MPHSFRANRSWTTVAAALALIYTGCRDAKVDTLFLPVSRGDVMEEVVASGVVSARTKVNVGSQISGTVREVTGEIGATVRIGQPLAQLDTRMLDAQCLRSKASLQKALAQRQQAEVQLQSATRTASRLSQLAQQQLLAVADSEAADLARAQGEAALALAEASVTEARADLQTALTQKNLATLRSPIDGVIIDRQIEVGQTVAAQFQVATLFTIAQDLTQVMVLANIDEADMGRVRVGMRVTFFADAYPGRGFVGTLQALRPAPQGSAQNTTTDTASVVTYLAEIAADNGDHALFQGMTTQVRITTAQKHGVLRVPAAALRFSPKDAPQVAAPAAGITATGRVWVRSEDTNKKALSPRTVTLGLSDGAFVEAVEGLGEGLCVAVAQNRAADGKKGRRGML